VQRTTYHIGLVAAIGAAWWLTAAAARAQNDGDAAAIRAADEQFLKAFNDRERRTNQQESM
jgi:hypothetical protein